jgi:hypothetical protein
VRRLVSGGHQKLFKDFRCQDFQGGQ